MYDDFTRHRQAFNTQRSQRATLKPNQQQSKTDSRKNKSSFPKTFRQICDEVRIDNANRVFERGRQASKMRHLAIKLGRQRQARLFADIKCMVLKRAHRLAPDIVSVGLDSDYQIGLIRVLWPGKGALHLPPDTDIG